MAPLDPGPNTCLLRLKLVAEETLSKVFGAIGGEGNTDRIAGWVPFLPSAQDRAFGEQQLQAVSPIFGETDIDIQEPE